MIKKIKEIFKEQKKNPIYQKYEYAFLPTFSAIVFLGLVTLVIAPNVTKLIETNRNIEDLIIRKQSLETKLRGLEQSDPETVKKNIETTLMALPEDKDIPGAINQLLYLVNTNNLILTGVSFTPASGVEDGTSTYQVKMDVTGDLINLRNFVNRIKENVRLLKPDSLEITGARFTEIQSTIAVKVYFQPLQNSIGDVEKPLPVITQKDLEALAKIKDSATINSQISGVADDTQKGKADPFQ